MDFKDVDTKRKNRICREVAFIIKDMTLLYNGCNDGGPQIQMEFLGYRSEQDERKVFNPKPTTFTYFNRLRRKNRPRFPISDHLTNQDHQVKPLKHEDDPTEPRFHDPKAGAANDEGGAQTPPYSDQEHDLHRIRDRIRIRLNLLDVDFKNLEAQLTVEQKRRAERQRPLEEMLDGDRLAESEKEALPSEEEETDEVQACLRANRKLMEQMADQEYKQRVLGTLECAYDFRETAQAWRKKVRRRAVAKELEEKKQKAREDIIAYLTEG